MNIILKITIALVFIILAVFAGLYFYITNEGVQKKIVNTFLEKHFENAHIESVDFKLTSLKITKLELR